MVGVPQGLRRAHALHVGVQVNTPEASELAVAVELPEGFGAEQSRFELEPLHDGQERAVEFRFTAADDTPRLAEGTLTVGGKLRGEDVFFAYPIRLAVGAVAYTVQEEYEMQGRVVTDNPEMLVLDNSYIQAKFIADGAIVHDLVLRDTGTDHLIPGRYPFGWVWYSFRAGWQLEEVSGPGERVRARVVGAHPADGTPITVLWSLEQNDNHLTIEIETGEAGPVSNAFYLMSRIGVMGEGERSIWPTAEGLQSLAWRGGVREVAAGDFSERWLAVQDDASDQTFGCIYHFPALDRVRVSPGSSGFNYMVFYPRDDRRIGNVTFVLSATPGGVDRVQDLYRQLNLQ